MTAVDLVLAELKLRYGKKGFVLRDMRDFAEQHGIKCLRSAFFNLEQKGKLAKTGEKRKDGCACMYVYQVTYGKKIDHRKAVNKYVYTRGMSADEVKANAIGVRLHEACNRMTRIRHEAYSEFQNGEWK